jgi:hypothetical protein
VLARLDVSYKERFQTTSSTNMTPIITRGHISWNFSRRIVPGLCTGPLLDKDGPEHKVATLYCH